MKQERILFIMLLAELVLDFLKLQKKFQSPQVLKFGLLVLTQISTKQLAMS